MPKDIFCDQCPGDMENHGQEVPLYVSDKKSQTLMCIPYLVLMRSWGSALVDIRWFCNVEQQVLSLFLIKIIFVDPELGFMQISTCAESPAENIPLSFKECREMQIPPLWGRVGAPVPPALSLLWPMEGLEWGVLPWHRGRSVCKRCRSGPAQSSYSAPELLSSPFHTEIPLGSMVLCKMQKW